VFGNKQRLISHLSRNNKCYDVVKIGMPPILMELMGFAPQEPEKEQKNPREPEKKEPKQEPEKKEPKQEPEKKEPEHGETEEEPEQEETEEEPEQEETEEMTQEEMDQEQAKLEHDQRELFEIIEKDKLRQIEKERQDKIDKERQDKIEKERQDNIEKCDNCGKVFATKRNLEKHVSLGRCQKITIDDKIPGIFKSKSEHKKQKNVNIRINHSVDASKRASNVKYIVKEDYVDYLKTIMGSENEAFKFIRSCIQGKIAGGVNLLYKVYFEGKEHADYPFEVIDAKAKKISYKTPTKMVLDEGSMYVKSIMVENLRNCYLKFCNHVISSNLDDNTVIFDDYDLGEIQNHVLELSDDKKKDRIILGLIEQTK
jgi:hypothetical protein